MAKKKSTDFKDIGVRALKTFVQAFLSVVALGVTDVTNLDSLQALAVAGVAAGVSAAWNFVKETV